VNAVPTSPSLAIVGDLPELTPSLLPDVMRFSHASLDTLTRDDRTICAVAVDLRDVSGGDLERWVARGDHPDAPLVLVTTEAVEPAIDADDIIVVPVPRFAFGRRLRLAVDLGRTRSTLDAILREDQEREAERRRFEHLAAMGTMVAGFAHEVRNPVAALRSIAEELAEELSSVGLALPHAQRMLVILERVERLVRTSLQFGRPAAPRRGAHRPWTICSAALAGVAARTLPTGHHLRIEVEPDLPDVFVDDAQIVQALVILLENALDATSSPRGVLVRVTRDHSPDLHCVRFEVIDDGPGIAPADLSRIFDPFFTTKATGTGLGLSIAQQIVRENGGRIEVGTATGAPTSFSIIVTSRRGSSDPGSL
jgi:signal transduction histidine kinase